MTELDCAESIHLHAGPVSMIFEPATAMLRYVRLDDVELLRGVYAAVRDQDWNTVPFTLHDFQLQSLPDHFSLSFVAKCSQQGIRFDWRGELTGSTNGSVRFVFRGEAKSTFLKNRIGLCVLHPIQPCAGRPCTIDHTDGSKSSSIFPQWISPHQPFKAIQAITHDVSAEIRVRIAFSGETFEMEDQRNWTDASYKTYCTPLAQPFPVEIVAGSVVDQAVTIELLGVSNSISKVDPFAPAVRATIPIRIDWAKPRPLPPIGLSMATCQESMTSAVVERLRQLQPAHLRVDLHLDRDDWTKRLQEAMDLSSSIDSQLEVALFASEVGDKKWNQCLQQLAPVRERIARWLVFHSTAKATPEAIGKDAMESLQKFCASAPIVVGTNAYFAELNRHRPEVASAAAVCFSTNPQVHASDKRSIVETLQAYRWTVESAEATFRRPVVVSPITLRPRFNPNVTSAGPGGEIDEPESDPRQASGFTAAWTTGVFGQLAAHPNVSSLTLFETYGPRGIISSTGEDYAVSSVFDALVDCRAVFRTTVASELDVAAVAMEWKDGRLGLMLANMSNSEQSVSVNGNDGRELSWRLNAESVRLVAIAGHP